MGRLTPILQQEQYTVSSDATATYRNPRSGSQFVQVYSHERSGGPLHPIHSVGRSGGEPRDKLGSGADSDDVYLQPQQHK
jgi:hypothetical protein